MSLIEIARPVEGQDIVAYINEHGIKWQREIEKIDARPDDWEPEEDDSDEIIDPIEFLQPRLTHDLAKRLKNDFGRTADQTWRLLSIYWQPYLYDEDLHWKEYSKEIEQTVFQEVFGLEPSLGTDFLAVLDREVGPVQELIPGLVEKGVATMLAGPGGTHKSRTALHWGLAISEGAAVYGRPTERARFIFLSYEDHRDEVTRRAQAMTRRLGLDWGDNAEYWDMTSRPESLAIVSEHEGIVLQPLYHKLHKYLKQTPGHKFVVLDSTYNVLDFRGQAKVNEPSVKAAIELLNRLCRETDSTIIFLWHPSQAGQERGDASGWSVAWHNAPRARLSLSKARNGDSVIDGAFDLKIEKRNNGPIGQPLTLHWDDGVLLPITAVGSAERESLFLDAVVKVALQAAADGTPLTKQKNPYPWQLSEIELACGRRPTNKEFKAELARAASLRRLRYVNGHGRQQAGYYPFDGAQTDGMGHVIAKQSCAEDI